MSPLSEQAKADLGSLAERLEGLAAGLAKIDGQLIWGVPRKVVRAYVWAIYQGEDAASACADAWFGASTTHTADVRAVSAAWAARLTSFRLNIPARHGAEVAA